MSSRGRGKKKKKSNGSAALPALSPKKAAQMLRASTPTKKFNLRNAGNVGINRASSDVFAYSGLGAVFSDDHRKSEMTASLRKELQKRSKKQKVKRKTQTKSSDSGAVPTSSSTGGENIRLPLVKMTPLVEQTDETMVALEEDQTSLEPGADALARGDTVKTVIEDDNEIIDGEQKSQEVVDDEDDSATEDEEVDTMKLETVKAFQRQPSMAVARSQTTAGFKLNFKIDFTKVNFKRKYEEKQKALQDQEQPEEGNASGELISKVSQNTLSRSKNSMESLFDRSIVKAAASAAEVLDIQGDGNDDDDDDDDDDYDDDSFDDYSDDFEDEE